MRHLLTPGGSGPTSSVRMWPKHTNFSIFGIRFQRRRHSFRPPGKSVGQERAAAQSLRPEILAGHYPPRNSLPAVAQTGAAADATSQNFSLRAPASVQMGGELHQCLTVCFQAVQKRASDFFFYFMWLEFCVARSACIPCAVVFLHNEADPHTTRKFFIVCGSAFFVGATSAKGSRRRRDTKPCGNTGKRIARARRSSPGSSCGPRFI